MRSFFLLMKWSLVPLMFLTCPGRGSPTEVVPAVCLDIFNLLLPNLVLLQDAWFPVPDCPDLVLLVGSSGADSCSTCQSGTYLTGSGLWSGLKHFVWCQQPWKRFNIDIGCTVLVNLLVWNESEMAEKTIFRQTAADSEPAVVALSLWRNWGSWQ